MILIIDDVRGPKELGFNPADCMIAKTVEAAIELFLVKRFDIISVDHDLGTEKTGYDFLNFIEEKIFYNDISFSLPDLRVHSANPVGKKRMLQVIEKINDAYELRTATMNKLNATQ